MASKRFLIVPLDSSAARMPRPGATMASATLLSSVRFIARSSMCGSTAGSLCLTAGRGGSGGGFKNLDAGQHLPLEPFKEGAARGRNISEAAGDAGQVERRHGVAAAGDADELAIRGEFRGGFRHGDGAVVERFHLEGAERAVPDQRLGARQDGNHVRDGARADIEDHIAFADLIYGNDARG